MSRAFKRVTSETDSEQLRNFVGMKWNKQILEKEGKRRLPSFNEIVEGIILEAVSQLRKHSGLARGSQELLQAQNNITKSWHEHFFSQVELSDSSKPLERNEL